MASKPFKTSRSHTKIAGICRIWIYGKPHPKDGICYRSLQILRHLPETVHPGAAVRWELGFQPWRHRGVQYGDISPNRESKSSNMTQLHYDTLCTIYLLSIAIRLTTSYLIFVYVLHTYMVIQQVSILYIYNHTHIHMNNLLMI